MAAKKRTAGVVRNELKKLNNSQNELYKLLIKEDRKIVSRYSRKMKKLADALKPIIDERNDLLEKLWKPHNKFNTKIIKLRRELGKLPGCPKCEDFPYV